MLNRLVAVPLILLGASGAAHGQQSAASFGVNMTPGLANRLSVQRTHEMKRLEILQGLDFFSGEPAGVSPPQTTPSDIDVHRSLFVHDRATLDSADFSLSRTLGQIANQVSTKVPGTTAVGVFRQFWDTQNPAPGVASGPHCTDDDSRVNGFPNSCRPSAEGQEALGTDAVVEATMNGYRTLALVNRLDLAHEGWRNCGEFRIIYGKPENGSQRNFIIFEAVLPNPKPGCREGCLDVAKFWKSLSAIDDPAQRAAKLEQFFYAGLPGYRPVVHVDHYNAQGVSGGYGSSGSGQIRTNQFMSPNPSQIPWMLKEFKTVIDCGATPCKFEIAPIMVKVNPFGGLWNEDIANNPGPLQTRAHDFQNDVILNTEKLANANLMGIGYSVDLEHDAAQSFSLAFLAPPDTPAFVDAYLVQFQAATGTTNTFRTDLGAAATDHGLTADQLVNRAMTQSCAGCHMPSMFGLQALNSIGPVNTPTGTLTTSWPDALSFVHVDAAVSVIPLPEFSTSSAFGSGLGQPISPALHNAFLPDRKNFLVSQLNTAECACRSRFLSVDPTRRPLLLKAQRDVVKKFDPQLKKLHEQREIHRRSKIPGAEQKRQAVEARIRALTSQREREVEAELDKLGVKAPAIDLQPTSLQLSAAQLGGGNAQRERALRRQQVLNMVKEQPPRRTVTNSFRVH